MLPRISYIVPNFQLILNINRIFILNILFRVTRLSIRFKSFRQCARLHRREQRTKNLPPKALLSFLIIGIQRLLCLCRSFLCFPLKLSFGSYTGVAARREPILLLRSICQKRKNISDKLRIAAIRFLVVIGIIPKKIVHQRVN
ncbi:hypothetical protein CBM2605_A260063 [Cupriavidus neocaledonicus]|uniref:Uncharacterized protein n=1 Tax=Cupriavidus neocaledonicus TaxID=1040979 RepID=A0ABY1V0U4_9BURK|nr:hypothetical protein CBM2605_A260063 [Cupriavidus neocaledonicus]